MNTQVRSNDCFWVLSTNANLTFTDFYFFKTFLISPKVDHGTLRDVDEWVSLSIPSSSKHDVPTPLRTASTSWSACKDGSQSLSRRSKSKLATSACRATSNREQANKTGQLEKRVGSSGQMHYRKKTLSALPKKVRYSILKNNVKGLYSSMDIEKLR